ncbi:unnamed protein product [Brassica oleracea var. botrytis]|uniref:(rape) hypothetical protein n=1 Tax=Brassica napus TaxID=3708 RepID=A0A816KJF6_BRANA|nr:unnamed protein product [Brassica napus]
MTCYSRVISSLVTVSSRFLQRNAFVAAEFLSMESDISCPKEMKPNRLLQVFQVFVYSLF